MGFAKRLTIEAKPTGLLSSAEKREKDFESREKLARSAVTNHPLIAEARALFGGELGPIELLGDRKND